jgi:hypothetical protein
MLPIHGDVRRCEVIAAACLDWRHTAARRIHVKSAAQMKIDNINNASYAIIAARTEPAAAIAK